MEPAQDLHVLDMVPLISPNQLKAEIPMTEAAAETVSEARTAVKNIFHRQDDRLMVLIGPCSIHDPAASLEYAAKLAEYARQMKDRLVIVMRTYFEKPRTTFGWRGLINDPHLDGSYDMAEGLRLARKLLVDVNSMGLPTAVEMLDPVTPQYIAELVCCTAIGARTTESQTHRALASGLSMPVGFKNATDGGLQVAIDAAISARNRHSFLGIDLNGRSCVVKTTGNPDGTLILRGGRNNTNYDVESIFSASEQLANAGLISTVMVDCSHANSGYDVQKQKAVWKAVIDERPRTAGTLVGIMVESNLFEGKQPIASRLEDLKYGVSVTDACMGWEPTEELLQYTYEKCAPSVVSVP
jgi:3-deoxy-7-phosphoheptulonate synthase